ncbi:MAG: hypothetical protein KME42_13765 [Tildeniella nuda ZEHNDER 1965/U140]|jgi:hypothetical protein|nr:hypothetical protein [Tildeniella nuda ZEHNDER 1965/U140]
MTNLADTTKSIDVAALKANLVSLAKLAPEVCSYYTRHESAGKELEVTSHFTLAKGHTITLTNDQIISQPEWQNWAALQWAIQQAIALRGWVIDAESYHHADTNESRWDVFVYDKGRIAIDGASYRCDDANPAIALLQAFISALQGEVTA